MLSTVLGTRGTQYMEIMSAQYEIRNTLHYTRNGNMYSVLGTGTVYKCTEASLDSTVAPLDK